jgi:hypothetical protein
LKNEIELNKIIERYKKDENIYIQMHGKIFTREEFKKRYKKISDRNNLWSLKR